jgi:hypothetical protein
MFAIDIIPISDFMFATWMIDRINLTFGQFAIKYLYFNLEIVLPIGLGVIGIYLYFAMYRQKRIKNKNMIEIKSLR